MSRGMKILIALLAVALLAGAALLVAIRTNGPARRIGPAHCPFTPS